MEGPNSHRRQKGMLKENKSASFGGLGPRAQSPLSLHLLLNPDFGVLVGVRLGALGLLLEVCAEKPLDSHCFRTG